MIPWLIFFLLIVGISFILAFQSMRDYHEIPQGSKVEYGLFLIRQTVNFNEAFLDSLGKIIAKDGLIVSIERLIKGNRSALTIYGPKKILQDIGLHLDLLELEDYALSLKNEDTSVWEIGLKLNSEFNPSNLNNLFKELPALAEDDQFFWQVILGVKTEKEHSVFKTQIRAGILVKDSERKRHLASQLHNFASDELIKVPRPFLNEQMLEFFKSRSLSKDAKGPELDSEGVMHLVKIS